MSEEKDNEEEGRVRSGTGEVNMLDGSGIREIALKITRKTIDHLQGKPLIILQFIEIYLIRFHRHCLRN